MVASNTFALGNKTAQVSVANPKFRTVEVHQPSAFRDGAGKVDTAQMGVSGRAVAKQVKNAGRLFDLAGEGSCGTLLSPNDWGVALYLCEEDMRKAIVADADAYRQALQSKTLRTWLRKQRMPMQFHLVSFWGRNGSYYRKALAAQLTAGTDFLKQCFPEKLGENQVVEFTVSADGKSLACRSNGEQLCKMENCVELVRGLKKIWLGDECKLRGFNESVEKKLVRNICFECADEEAESDRLVSKASTLDSRSSKQVSTSRSQVSFAKQASSASLTRGSKMAREKSLASQRSVRSINTTASTSVGSMPDMPYLSHQISTGMLPNMDMAMPIMEMPMPMPPMGMGMPPMGMSGMQMNPMGMPMMGMDNSMISMGMMNQMPMMLPLDTPAGERLSPRDSCGW